MRLTITITRQLTDEEADCIREALPDWEEYLSSSVDRSIDDSISDHTGVRRMAGTLFDTGYTTTTKAVLEE